LLYAVVVTDRGNKPTYRFHPFIYGIFGTVKYAVPIGGTKYLLGVIAHFLNYIWLLALPSKTESVGYKVVARLQFSTSFVPTPSLGLIVYVTVL
jgi:hypothetical protein